MACLAISIAAGNYAAASCVATANMTVKICSPAANSNDVSPVQFSAGALDNSHPITGMILYVDSTIKAKSSNGSLSASVALALGKHAIVIRAWDSTGAYFSAQESITVVAPTPTPTATATAKPTATPTATIVPTATVKPTATATVAPTATATPTATPSPSPADITAVNHVIFMMQENRSFDTYFGMLNPYRHEHGWDTTADGTLYDVDGIDDKLNVISNQDDEGQTFKLFHATSTCLDDMSSAWLESYGDVSRWDFTPSRPIAMDGFVHTAEGYAKFNSNTGQFTDFTGQRAMGYYADTDFAGSAPELNYYYYMASNFALSDRWFSTVSSKTVPNRVAVMSGGTTQGYVFDPGNDDHAPQLTAKTIFEALDDAGVSWKIYYAHTNSDGSPSTIFTYFIYSGKYISRTSSGTWNIDSSHIAPMSQYYSDVQNGTLPHFAFIEADYGVDDEHPGSGQSILKGQQGVAQIVNALMYSKSWSDSVFFLGFDEGGGPYDHVPPVPGHTNQNTDGSLAGVEGDVSAIAVNPDGYEPCVPQTAGVFSNHCDLRPNDPGASPNDAPAQFGFAAQLGFRVPNFIVSPFVRPHYVGHAAMDHTAVIHFVEERFGLSPLTKRDAAQPDLLDFFDFTGKPWATPPPQSQLPAPPAVGSTCHASSFN